MKPAILGLLTAAAIAASSLATAEAASVTVAGGVTANGHRQVLNSAFVVSHPSTGRYIIDFSSSYAPYPTCIFMPVGPFSVIGITEKASSCDVTFINTRTGNLANVLFNFVAVQTNH